MSRLLQFCDTSMLKGSSFGFFPGRLSTFRGGGVAPQALQSREALAVRGLLLLRHHRPHHHRWVPSSFFTTVCHHHVNIDDHCQATTVITALTSPSRRRMCDPAKIIFNFLHHHHPASTLSLSRFLKGFWFLLFGLICFPLLNSNVKIL